MQSLEDSIGGKHLYQILSLRIFDSAISVYKGYRLKPSFLIVYLLRKCNGLCSISQVATMNLGAATLGAKALDFSVYLSRDQVDSVASSCELATNGQRDW
jgi:hypothetical protein